ncbi:MAG: hypothetical protein WAN46_14540 [Gammaproteobacteria bacterium]
MAKPSDASRSRSKRRCSGANAADIEAFKARERIGNEPVELGSAGVIQPIGCQDALVKPLQQCLHVAGQAG